jgi:hypothetical protein
MHTAAVNAGKLPAHDDLFSYVFTGHTATKKRSLSAKTIAMLHAADLSACPRLEYCRDMFMICFLLQGMPFVDLIHLRKCDWKGDLLKYIRQKTKSPISVYALSAAIAYLRRLVNNEANTPYLLPFVTLDGREGRRQYENALRMQNDRLKDLAAHLGITENLSTHVARHSWATLAHKNEIRIATISKAMGHKTEEMTQIYINSIDQEEYKEANEAVFDAVMQPILNGEVTNVREEVRLELEQQMPKPKPVRRKAKPKPKPEPEPKPVVLPEPEPKAEPIVEAAQPVEKPVEKPAKKPAKKTVKKPVKQQPAQQTPMRPQPENKQKRKAKVCNNFKSKKPVLKPVKTQKKKHLNLNQWLKLGKKERKEEIKRIKQKKTKILRHPIRDGG